MIVIAAKPEPLVSIIVDPIMGDAKMALNPKLIKLYGSAYPGMVRQELERALKVMKEYEKSVSL